MNITSQQKSFNPKFLILSVPTKIQPHMSPHIEDMNRNSVKLYIYTRRQSNVVLLKPKGKIKKKKKKTLISLLLSHQKHPYKNCKI